MDYQEIITRLPTFFTNHLVLCVFWLGVTGALIYMQTKLLLVRIPKTSSNSAVMMVNHDDAIFLDHRTPEIFAKGHITNSVNVPTIDIRQQKFQRIEKSRDKAIILVGRDKFDSDGYNVARVLKKSGFRRIFILEGGIATWQDENLPLSTKN